MSMRCVCITILATHFTTNYIKYNDDLVVIARKIPGYLIREYVLVIRYTNNHEYNFLSSTLRMAFFIFMTTCCHFQSANFRLKVILVNIYIYFIFENTKFLSALLPSFWVPPLETIVRGLCQFLLYQARNRFHSH